MLNRIQRVDSLIQKELSQIILREVEFSPDIFVTLTRVETVPNLTESKIFISVLPEGKLEIVLKILNKNIYNLQKKLNKRLRMRPIPRIVFLKEKTTSEAGRIEEILESLKK
jgi:ribosome-binding factor A